MDTGEVAKIESDFMNKRRLKTLKVEIVKVSDDKTYDFQELCYDIRKKIINFHAGVGDSFHTVIMENNKINNILTFDEKKDFKQIPNLKVFHPRDIAKQINQLN